SSADDCRSFGLQLGEGAAAVGDAGASGIRLEHAECGMGALQRLLVLDLGDRRDPAASLGYKRHIGDLMAHRHGNELGLKSRRERYCAVDHRPRRVFGGDVDQKSLEHVLSPTMKAALA